MNRRHIQSVVVEQTWNRMISSKGQKYMTHANFSRKLLQLSGPKKSPCILLSIYHIKNVSDKSCRIYILCHELGLSVSIVTGYGQDDQMIGVGFPVGAEKFSLQHHTQIGSGAHPASYPMGTRGSFPEGKAAGHETDHSPPSSADVQECVELYLHSPTGLHGVVLS